jgi:hypothetical protein
MDNPGVPGTTDLGIGVGGPRMEDPGE